MTPFDLYAEAHPFAALLALCTFAVVLFSPLLAAFAVWRFLRLLSRIAEALEARLALEQFHTAEPILTEVAKSEMRHALITPSAFGR